jgi:hemerythrin-like metal-binding protein
MRTFVWTRQLLIGHERIDSDHKTLIGLIGDVEEMLESERRISPAFGQAYDRFLHFLIDHCTYEEDLMHQLPPLYQSRVQEHCHHHGILISQARSVAELLVPDRPCAEVLATFQRAIISMTRDLIMDDVELVGILLLENSCLQPL